MTNAEAVNWLINITADIGKAEHSDLWHYEQALSEIREMLEDAQSRHYHEENLLTYAHDMGVTLEQAKKELQKATEQPETHDKRTETHACDLIDRQAAIDALGEKPLVWDDLSDFDLGKAAQWSDDVDAIKALPSAQQERMKGRWKRKESDISWWYECSKCGEPPLFDPYENEVLTPFCPWCGAEMETEGGRG